MIKYIIFDVKDQVQLHELDSKEEAEELLATGACTADSFIYTVMAGWRIVQVLPRALGRMQRLVIEKKPLGPSVQFLSEHYDDWARGL